MIDQEIFEQLKTICEEKAKDLDEKYKTRLAEELKEINAKNESEYFLKLTGKRENENNLLIPHLLGICDDFNIDSPPKYEYGELPDIDVDYLPSIRNYLKEQYAREKFGEDYVCNIATYTTFGLRSSLIDMAKVFDLDRREILALTTRLGIKDDEGEILTWDKAIELYDDLREYLEQNPEMADAARRILHRNRNMGMHASGLIISGVPIKDFVPLVRVKESAQACSAWVEGLHGTDLGAVGLVKLDFLSLEGNMKIAQATKMASDLIEINKELDLAEGITGVESSAVCCEAIQETEKMIGNISALPGKSNWTDTRYLDDDLAIKMADKGDLKMIFQYDGSDGIRRLAKQGGINSFNDLVAYTALYRPGPMKLNYHETYCNRKRGKEKYEVHPILKDFMSFTYGVLTYQEQIMRLLNVVGKVPLKDCEIVRKFISKKKKDKFQKYKDMFVENGQKVLGWTKEELEHTWKQIEAFAGYGFNLCVSGNTSINIKGKKPTAIKDVKIGDLIECVDNSNRIICKKVTAIHNNGTMPVLNLKTRTGRSITSTKEHKFLTVKGWKHLDELKIGDRIAIPRKLFSGTELCEDYKLLTTAYLITESNCCHPSSLYFYNKNEDLLDSFSTNAKMFENTVTRREMKNSCYTIVANTGSPNGSKGKSGIYNWANKHGLIGKKATEKSVPDFIWNLNSTCLSKFLGAAWSCDGHLGKKKRNQIFYATSSEELANEFVNLHLRLGVVLSKRKKSFKYKNSTRIGYALYVVGGQSKSNFLSLIAPYCIGRQEEIEWLKTNSHTGEDFIDTLPCESMDLIVTASHGMSKKELFKKTNLTERLFYKDANKKGIRRSTMLEIASALDSMQLLHLSTSDVYWDEIKSITDHGSENVYDITVDDHHNYVANCIISHNSHAVAYTYISSRMLYLKAHFPLAFYTKVIDCTKAAGPKDYQKLKDYKQEALKHGIKANPVDINKSKCAVSAIDGEMYWGFSKLKTVGDDAAIRMEKMQPYADYKDFLTRFGTDAKANQAVIALRLFPGDPIEKYEYYEAYKDWEKKKTEREKRFKASIERYTIAMQNLVDSKNLDIQVDLTEENYEYIRQMIDCQCHKKLDQLWKKIRTCKTNFDNRNATVPQIEECKIDSEFNKLLLSKELAEEHFYGFVWDHPIEKCKYYSGHTFEEFESQNNEVGPIEILVRNVRQMKGPKATYYSLEVEDANSQVGRITIWTSDYKRFEDILKKGQFLRLMVKAPSDGFTNYTLTSAGNKWHKPTQSLDKRVFQIS
jgi:DNA polymerase-3 subunit alpha